MVALSEPRPFASLVTIARVEIRLFY